MLTTHAAGCRSMPNLRHDHLRTRFGPALRFSVAHFVPKGEPLCIRYVVRLMCSPCVEVTDSSSSPCLSLLTDLITHEWCIPTRRTRTGPTRRERCARRRGDKRSDCGDAPQQQPA